MDFIQILAKKDWTKFIANSCNRAEMTKKGKVESEQNGSIVNKDAHFQNGNNVDEKDFFDHLFEGVEGIVCNHPKSTILEKQEQKNAGEKRATAESKSYCKGIKEDENTEKEKADVNIFDSVAEKMEQLCCPNSDPILSLEEGKNKQAKPKTEEKDVLDRIFESIEARVCPRPTLPSTDTKQLKLKTRSKKCQGIDKIIVNKNNLIVNENNLETPTVIENESDELPLKSDTPCYKTQKALIIWGLIGIFILLLVILLIYFLLRN